MADNCKLVRGSVFDCDAIATAGIKSYIYLINFDDYESRQTLTRDGTTNEITALVLASGTQGYKFESSKGSAQIIPSSPIRAVTAIDGFDHTLDVRIPNATQLNLDNVKKMRFQKVVGIVPLLDGRFRLYGAKVGMRISDFQENPGDADIGGTIQMVLKTPDNDPPEVDPPDYIASSFDITSLDSPAA